MLLVHFHKLHLFPSQYIAFKIKKDFVYWNPRTLWTSDHKKIEMKVHISLQIATIHTNAPDFIIFTHIFIIWIKKRHRLIGDTQMSHAHIAASAYTIFLLLRYSY